MDKLNMHTVNKVNENFAKLAQLFPNAVTESIVDGEVVRSIDKDVLMQEISGNVVEGKAERYQFTWPDKKKSVLLANAPSYKTLRPIIEDETIPTGSDSMGNPYSSSGSVDFDTTENLYIEGDNLDALKLLQETYLGKIKMIYIDPPYNTGKDFVYSDKFKQSVDEYMDISGELDEEGNRLFTNSETNGRYHTDWLNMMYPRLRLAKDLLKDDGVIFISIDDNEVENLKKMCNEVFGEWNFRNQIVVRRGAKSVQAQFDTWDKLGQDIEYILFYSKNAGYRFPQQTKKLEEKRGGVWNNHWRGTDRPTMRYPLFGIVPVNGQWRWSKERSEQGIANYMKMLEDLGEKDETVAQETIDRYYLNKKKNIDLLRLSKKGKPEHYIAPTDSTLLNSSWYDLLIGSSSEISKLFNEKLFETAKLTTVIKRMLNFINKDDIILDFFSGSATTAHAVMQLNAEDGGDRKFICVQLPELIEEKHEAYKAGYKNICEIGKERIRRAGAKIKAENKDKEGIDQLDTGFRVFKVDSSNMKDIYYDPKLISQSLLDELETNIKEDRSPEDLLFQVMLDLGILLSNKIETEIIEGKKIFTVYQGEVIYLIACFENDITTEVVTDIAKHKPYYAIFKDQSMQNDSLMNSFEQIFKAYSKDTIRKVI